MTDELDPQTQQHIDDSADTIDDCDTSTSSDGGIVPLSGGSCRRRRGRRR